MIMTTTMAMTRLLIFNPFVVNATELEKENVVLVILLGSTKRNHVYMVKGHSELVNLVGE